MSMNFGVEMIDEASSFKEQPLHFTIEKKYIHIYIYIYIYIYMHIIVFVNGVYGLVCLIGTNTL